MSEVSLNYLFYPPEGPLLLPGRIKVNCSDLLFTVRSEIYDRNRDSHIREGDLTLFEVSLPTERRLPLEIFYILMKPSGLKIGHDSETLQRLIETSDFEFRRLPLDSTVKDSFSQGHLDPYAIHVFLCPTAFAFSESLIDIG